MIEAAVVIPTRDRADLLARCVRAVESTVGDTEIVVSEGQVPFAQNCNRGAQMASDGVEVLVFLNDDAEPSEDWLPPLVSAAAAHGVAGATILNRDGSLQHTGVFLRKRAGVLEAFNSVEPRESGPVPAVTGACMAVRRDLFDELGGFDGGAYRNGYEDVALCLSARQAGYKVWYAAESVVEHDESQSANRWDFVNENIKRLDADWGWLL